MGYGACSCECACPRYTEDGVMCGDCVAGRHSGYVGDDFYLERERGFDHDYDPPDPMEREP